MAAVNRALSLLEVFRREDDALSLAQLARRTGFHKSTILRLAESLIGFGYLRREENGTFCIGPAPLRLGSVYLHQLHPEALILAVLRDLSRVSHESATVYVRAGNFRLCAHRVRSPRAIIDNVQQGELLPLNEGAGGLVLMAFGGAVGEPYAAIRARGTVLTRGQRDNETAALAAPVFGIGQKLQGALSLSGPIHRFDARAVARLVPLLAKAAARLSQELGGSPLERDERAPPFEPCA